VQGRRSRFANRDSSDLGERREFRSILLLGCSTDVKLRRLFALAEKAVRRRLDRQRFRSRAKGTVDSWSSERTYLSRSEKLLFDARRMHGDSHEDLWHQCSSILLSEGEIPPCRTNVACFLCFSRASALWYRYPIHIEATHTFSSMTKT